MSINKKSLLDRILIIFSFLAFFVPFSYLFLKGEENKNLKKETFILAFENPKPVFEELPNANWDFFLENNRRNPIKCQITIYKGIIKISEFEKIIEQNQKLLFSNPLKTVTEKELKDDQIFQNNFVVKANCEQKTYQIEKPFF